jgi:hypothetical protein
MQVHEGIILEQKDVGFSTRTNRDWWCEAKSHRGCAGDWNGKDDTFDNPYRENNSGKSEQFPQTQIITCMQSTRSKAHFKFMNDLRG